MKRGLVFGGGGGRGAYQIGVWRALRELDLEKDIAGISGASVGALNAALFLSGDLGIAEDVWFSIEPEKVLSTYDRYSRVYTNDGIDLSAVISNIGNAIDAFDRTLASISDAEKSPSLFSSRGLSRIVERNLDFARISAAEMPFYVSVLNTTLDKLEYQQLNGKSQKLISEYLLASSALPMVYEPRKIGVFEYVDGGLRDNCPLTPLYDEGLRSFIVVHLKTTSPSIAARFPDCDIIEIRPSDEYTGIIDGTLDFSAEGSQRRLASGYLDGIAQLEPYADID